MALMEIEEYCPSGRHRVTPSLIRVSFSDLSYKIEKGKPVISDSKYRGKIAAIDWSTRDTNDTIVVKIHSLEGTILSCDINTRNKSITIDVEDLK